jgi:zinc transport system substrate-binding protein
VRHLIIAVLAVFISAGAPAVGEARSKPAVEAVVSILPLHSLVAGVMQGVAEPYLLVPGGASPHSFALRPSDARRLDRAQVVFWVGPTLETFLERPLAALARDAVVVEMSELGDIALLPFREGGAWEAHDHGHDGTADRAHEDRPGDREDDRHAEHPGEHREDHDRPVDAHLWLDPMNAIAFVRTAAATLGRIDPGNKARYDLNAGAVVQRLQALDAALRTQLAPMHGKPYIVFHDAYRYFENRYGLTPAGAITVSPELAPGAKRLVEIRGRIREEAAICVFAEPEFEPKLVRTLVQGTEARTATLDPLGARLDAGPDAYFQLMRNLARDLVGCLSGPS